MQFLNDKAVGTSILHKEHYSAMKCEDLILSE